MKNKEKKTRTKIQNLEAKKLSPEELATVSGGVLVAYRGTCSDCREDDCGV